MKVIRYWAGMCKNLSIGQSIFSCIVYRFIKTFTYLSVGGILVKNQNGHNFEAS